MIINGYARKSCDWRYDFRVTVDLLMIENVVPMHYFRSISEPCRCEIQDKAHITTCIMLIMHGMPWSARFLFSKISLPTDLGGLLAISCQIEVMLLQANCSTFNCTSRSTSYTSDYCWEVATYRPLSNSWIQPTIIFGEAKTFSAALHQIPQGFAEFECPWVLPSPFLKILLLEPFPWRCKLCLL